jgi:hypothetical protein
MKVIRIKRYLEPVNAYHEKEYYYGKEEKKAYSEKTYLPTKTNGSGVKKEV